MPLGPAKREGGAFSMQIARVGGIFTCSSKILRVLIFANKLELKCDIF